MHLPDSLTPGEREVLVLIGRDKSSKEIARTLSCSRRKVDHQRVSLARKLGRTRQRLIVFAVRFVWWLEHEKLPYEKD